MLLASQGTAFTECLLWLYRSHGEHKKTLSYLTEDRYKFVHRLKLNCMYSGRIDISFVILQTDALTLLVNREVQVGLKVNSITGALSI